MRARMKHAAYDAKTLDGLPQPGSAAIFGGSRVCGCSKRVRADERLLGNQK
jgi:hypothetical protein